MSRSFNIADILIGVGIGVVGVCAVYAVVSWLKGREDEELPEGYWDERDEDILDHELGWDEEAERAEIDRIYGQDGEINAISGEIQEISEEIGRISGEIQEISSIPDIYKVVPMSAEKPPLEEVEVRVEEHVEIPPKQLAFSDGLPVFNIKDWESEDGNILLISQDEYLNSWPDHEKEQAAWFAMDQMLVDSNLHVMDIVDTVGPTAFTELMRSPEKTIFVKNEEMQTEYELFAYSNVSLQDAWDDRFSEEDHDEGLS